MPNTKNFNDARAVRSRRDLADALLQLLQEKNYEEITIKVLSSKALVSKNTFYNNFLDKNELLNYAFEERIKQIINETSKHILTNYESFNENVIDLTVDTLFSNKIPLKKMIYNDHNHLLYWQVNQFFFMLINQIMDIYQSDLPVNIEKNIVAAYHSAAFTNVIYYIIQNEKSLDKKTIKNTLKILRKIQ